MTPGRMDRLVVDRHLAALRRALAGLRRHAGVSPATLRADPDRQWTIERGLQLCAQNALDIASHLSSAAGYDPTTYGSSIDSLVEAKVLPPTGALRWGVVPHLRVLIQEAREPARIFVDIPIGLPGGPGGRECDRAARRALGALRGTSVFPAPARVVLGSVDYEDAKRRSQKATGKKLSRQTFDGIVRKCAEGDHLLCGDAQARRVLREVHPEI